MTEDLSKIIRGRFKFNVKTTEEWEGSSIKLLENELGIATDSNGMVVEIKIGDGEHLWAELANQRQQGVNVYKAAKIEGKSDIEIINDTLAELQVTIQEGIFFIITKDEKEQDSLVTSTAYVSCKQGEVIIWCALQGYSLCWEDF